MSIEMGCNTNNQSAGMYNRLHSAAKALRRRLGLLRGGFHASQPAILFPPDSDEKSQQVISQIRGCTMTTLEAQLSLINAVRYVLDFGIRGAFVECGVWRGGSSMAIALTLLQEGVSDRDIYLYDTFEGMTPPQPIDRTSDGVLASSHLEDDTEKTGVWCVSNYEEVRKNLASTGYPAERLHFIKGPVEKTIPTQAPFNEVALLRLDTDWYESTRHELVHLYPRLVSGGMLIIDDYGYWEGARRAVDEYFSARQKPYFLHRVDRSARAIVKTSGL